MIFHSTCSKPILIVGNGIHSAGAENLLHEFMGKTDIPVLTSMNAVDLVQDNERLGFIGTHGNRVANTIVTQCDLVISIGARLGLRQIGRYPQKFAPNAKIIRADIDEYELARTIREDDEEKYLIDAKDFLKNLLDEKIPKYTIWKNKCYEAKKYLDNYDNEVGNLTIKQIGLMLPENPIVAVDVGQNQCWTAQSLELKGKNGRILIGGGYGSMGCGLPFAVGASIAKKSMGENYTVYCITGDGGMQMNIQELETVHREKLPIKIFVINNKVLGKIWETQHKKHGDRFSVTAESGGYTVPDFDKVANAYGIRAISLGSYKDLYKCKDFIEDNKPCLINIMVPDANLISPKINWDTQIMDPDVDDKVKSKVLEILK